MACSSRSSYQAPMWLQYVMHFPKGEKFVSLLKNADDPESQARLEVERTRLRGLVRRQMADDMLLSEANEGRIEVPAAGSPVRVGPAEGGYGGLVRVRERVWRGDFR